MAQHTISQESQDFAADGDYVTDFSIAGGPGGSFFCPLHESITLSALATTGYNVAPGTTLRSANNADWEYIRGAVWNDDPAGELFDDTTNKNHTYALGLKWGEEFKVGEAQWKWNFPPGKMTNPIGRSHWGDLQFLHCMASNIGEKPEETKRKLIKWISVLWKLANGEEGINPETIIKNTDLAEFCPDSSLPSSAGSLRYLLSNDSRFGALDIPGRALGSILHFIQDSYAVAHTRRTLLNSEAKTSNDPLRFPQGVADRWGPIENFHVYNGQDSDKHKIYDHENESIPEPDNLTNLDQFNNMIGCRDAVEKCCELIKLKQAGKTWDTGVRQYLDEVVFPISPNATAAITGIWP